MAMLPLRRASFWGEQRRTQRFTCGPGQVVGLVVRGHRHVVPIYNISAGGAMIRMPRKLRVGERLTVAMGSGVVLPATVRWLDGERAGLSFDKD